MELLYTGKTKDVYRAGAHEVLLQFKDDVTGENGVFDPGANTVGLTIEGAGRSGLKMTTYFFEVLNAAGIRTHFIRADVEQATLMVREAKVFGKGLEAICRYRAVGSFLRRYGAYCEPGQPLDAFVEITIKDDERGDPTISADALQMLDILSPAEYDVLIAQTKDICSIVKSELAAKDLELYDIKLEFGRDAETGEIMLIDEISGGNMRVYKHGTYIPPLELEKTFLDGNR